MLFLNQHSIDLHLHPINKQQGILAAGHGVVSTGTHHNLCDLIDMVIVVVHDHGLIDASEDNRRAIL